jgi:cell division protein FtsW
MDVSIYRLRHRDILALCVLALVLLGVVMVQSAAMNVTGQVRWSWTERGTRHALFAIVAIVAFFLVGRFDYAPLGQQARSRFFHPILWALIIATATCLLVLIPRVGIEVNGARRWLPLGVMQIQPSELAKWGVVLFLAWWLTNKPHILEKFWTGFVPTLVPVAVLCLLIVIQDFGTAVLIAMCALTMLLACRAKWWHLAVVIPPALGAACVFVAMKDYRWRRMTAFIDPWATPQQEGYHMIQSLLSFATGGVSGRGLGNGIQKLGYLPEDTTDFIFAVICEELGLFGALLTIALYLGILYVAWQAVQQHRDNFGRMLAFGVGSMVGLQAMINIAVATVSVPTKGLSLPLVSAGGSGLIITSAALGLLYSVTRFVHAPETVGDPKPASKPAVADPKWKWRTGKPQPGQVSTSALSATAIWDLSVHH